jgi:hypothetical protein
MSRGTNGIDKLLVQGTMMDRRRKLTPDQVREIADLRYAMPATKVAEMFGVSKSTILFIWNPEARARNLFLRKLRGTKYGDTAAHTAASRNTREHKRALVARGVRLETSNGNTVRAINDALATGVM